MTAIHSPLYLPLANPAQRFFVNTGYQMNRLARWTVRQIGHLLLSPIPQELYLEEVADRVQTAVKVALAIPIVAGSFLLSTPCYLAASYVGIGRFEKIEAINPSNDPKEESIKVTFQNICGQNPWSVFSGGTVPPLEKDSEGNTRVDALIDHILQENPDVYCGQEFDDLATSEAIGKALAQQGYTCVRDLGCNDPIRNHSGLFIAVRGSTDSVTFHPFQPDHVSGIANWCQSGIMEVNVPLQNGRDIKVINVHLNPGGQEHQHSRLVQLGTYVAPLMDQHRSVVVGDSNLDTSFLSEEQKMTAGLIGTLNALEGQVTCTDEGKHILNGKPLDGCTDCEERIDVILHRPEEIAISDLTIQPGHSDHHLISFTAHS
ncbi:MAG: endonuclease/exonuclease/phosphatase family protein [Chlamydiales bacterium]|nr:endonuclease/exonuclease/phosphatase family protein [Chlamydiales bacterium]